MLGYVHLPYIVKDAIIFIRFVAMYILGYFSLFLYSFTAKGERPALQQFWIKKN